MFEYSILDNYVLYNNKLFSYFKLTPLDIELMAEEEKENFYLTFEKSLNQLREIDLKIMYINKEISIERYRNHFKVLRGKMFKDINTEEIRRKMVEEYILNIKTLIKNNFVPDKKIYLSIWESYLNKYPKSSYEKLNRKSVMVISAFTKCGLGIEKLTIKETQNILNSFFTL